MKPIKVIKNCKYEKTYFYVGDEVEPMKNNLEMIKKLNIGGYIEPLTQKDLRNIEKNVFSVKNDKEEK